MTLNNNKANGSIPNLKFYMVVKNHQIKTTLTTLFIYIITCADSISEQIN